MSKWQSVLMHDPLPALLSADNQAVQFFARRDLLGETGDVTVLWNLPQAQKICRKQQTDGSWLYPGGNQKVRTTENYNQLETFRNLGYLVEMYGFNRQSPVIEKAAEFLLSFQTDEGDIRGILGNQYTPYYTAAILELLIKAGYQDDARIHKAFQWLTSIRQLDGGWAIPFRTHGKNLDIISENIEPMMPDTSKPSSHLITGVVLRAYAAHPLYRTSPEAKAAAALLLTRLFKKDVYPDRSSKDFWLRFTYPFWFTDLISAMDSLSLIGVDSNDPQTQAALQWFIDHQDTDGIWRLKLLKNLHSDSELWLTLAISKIFKRIY